MRFVQFLFFKHTLEHKEELVIDKNNRYIIAEIRNSETEIS